MHPRRQTASTAAWWLMGSAVCWASLSPAATPQPNQVRAASAAVQAVADGPTCEPARPFYWEIGQASGPLAHGQAGGRAPDATTVMPIASASKWIYSAFVAQRRQGHLSEDDIRFLSFRSGYTRFHNCLPMQSVGSCATRLRNGRGEPDPKTSGRFDYNGGHMQQHAVTMGLGDLGPSELAATVRSTLSALGPDWTFDYGQAQPAGGGRTHATAYARFLQGLLRGELALGALLGQQATCTNPRTCPQAVYAPIPGSESWHYSLGHWVEDDPLVGDGAFSSPGAFGFYPWIDAGRTTYGILARSTWRGLGADDEDDRPAVQSVECGRALRAAWFKALGSATDRATR